MLTIPIKNSMMFFNMRNNNFIATFFLVFVLSILSLCKSQSTAAHLQHNLAHLRSSVVVQTALPTVTVRGFLNFRTTVDGTVIVFTPASVTAAESANNVNTPTIAPSIQSTSSPQLTISTKSVLEEIKPTKVSESIEPTQFSTQQQQQQQQQYPTGLVTVLGGTVVQNGATTVYETKVIGTYIDGKYAQILQSTAKVQSPPMTSPTIRPTQTYKAIEPSIVTEPTLKKPTLITKDDFLTDLKPPVFVDNNVISSPIRNSNFRNMNTALQSEQARTRLHSRLALTPGRSRWSQSSLQAEDKTQTDSTTNVNKIKKARLGTRRFTLPPRQSPRVRLNRFKAKLPATQVEERITYNSKLQSRTGHQRPQSLDLKQLEQLESELNNDNLTQESNTQTHNLLPLQPIDPSKVVKEIQTITSEVTQHVDGNHIQVKTLTLTTTLQRTLHPSEFETDVIAPTIPVEANDVEATSVQETPPLVISRTYSVTERSMRTTVVPVFDGTATTSHTVTESFFIRKLITAYKTMPPGDVFLLETASLSNSDSNYTNDLSVAEQSINPSLYQGIRAIEITDEPNNEFPTATPVLQPFVLPTLDPSMNLGLLGNNQMPQIDMNNPLFLAAALQNPQLAAVYLGLQQLKQQATQFNTITKPTTYVTTETIYNTKVVSFYDGRSTRSRTIVEPLTTSERTLTTYTTEVTPVINGNFALQQAQLQNVFATQLIGPQLQITPQINSITKTVTTVTSVTNTKTRVYTLVYNAFSTRYRTVTSTSVVPTTVTTVITSTIPVANTAAPFNIFG